MNRTTRFAPCLVLFAACAAFGQDDTPATKPAKPVFDALSKTTWDAWKKVEYNAGKEGLKQSAFKITATITSPQLPAPMTGTGDYAFDTTKSPKGTLTWSDQRVGMVLARQGWALKRFDGMHTEEKDELDGCTLTAVTKDKKTIVSVKGHKSKITGFVFNEKGVLESATISAQGQNIVFKMSFDEIDGKYLSTGWSYSLNNNGTVISSTVKLTNAKVGKYHLTKSVTETVARGGQTMAEVKIDFSGHTVDTPAAKPTSQPAKK